jgi:hypothetical protein
MRLVRHRRERFRGERADAAVAASDGDSDGRAGRGVRLQRGDAAGGKAENQITSLERVRESV